MFILLCLCSVVRELVRRNKMVINDEDEDSNTALHLASLAGHNKVVQALIDAGADIEARSVGTYVQFVRSHNICYDMPFIL